MRVRPTLRTGEIWSAGPELGGGPGSGFGAHGPDGLLELAGRQIEERLHLRREVRVMLEAQALGNHLQ